MLEIRSLHGQCVGTRQSATQSLEPPAKTTLKGLKMKIEGAKQQAANGIELATTEEILTLIERKSIVERDVEKLSKKAARLTAKEGNRWHRILLSGLHHPHSLRQVVFAGNKMLDQPSSVLVVAELPLMGRFGQVDFAVFVNKETDRGTIWSPLLIGEVKTRTGFDFNFYGKKTAKKSAEVYVPVSYVWKRSLADAEWSSLLNIESHERALEQLDLYEQTLLHEYQNIVKFDTNPPKSLQKAVVVVDSNGSPNDIFMTFHQILKHITSELEADSLSEQKVALVPESPTGKSMHTPHIGLLLVPADDSDTKMPEITSCKVEPSEDPFRNRVSDERLLTLYVAPATKTSSGIPAAWTARNWHLLHHIKECKEVSHADIEVFWIDLLGDYPTENLTNLRLGLDRLLSEKQISWEEHCDLKALVNSITFLDQSGLSDHVLRGDSDDIEYLLDGLESELECESEKIIIVDGISELSAMTPSHRHSVLQSFQLQLLQTLPKKDTNVIWLHDGDDDTLLSEEFQRKCVNPLRYDSPLRPHVDEIIYNLPTPPRSFGNLSPWREDVRVIVQDTPSAGEPWKTTIWVPHLVDTGRRFRGISRRDGLVTEADIDCIMLNKAQMHGRGIKLSSIQAGIASLTKDTHEVIMNRAISLVPSLLRPREGEEKEDIDSEEEREFRFSPQTISSSRPGQASLLRFQPMNPPPSNTRSKNEYVHIEKVTRGWNYGRTPPTRLESLTSDSKKVLRRPPNIQQIAPVVPDPLDARRLEVRRLESAARFLLKRSASSGIKRICEEILSYFTEVLPSHEEKKGANAHELLELLGTVRDIILSEPALESLWESLRPLREELAEQVNRKSLAGLEEVFEIDAGLFLLHGNNLLLLVHEVGQATCTSHYETLWEVVSGWIPYQIGLRPSDTEVSFKYDLHAIYANLLARARCLSDLGLPESSLSNYHAGEIIWSHGLEGTSAVVIFLGENQRLLCGVITGLGGSHLFPKWYRCQIDGGSLSEWAESALESDERTEVMVTRRDEQSILWMHDEEQDTWNPYLLEYGHPDKKKTLPWLKLSTIGLLPSTVSGRLIPPTKGSDVREHVDAYLRELAQPERLPISVRVDVSVDRAKKMYVVTFSGAGVDERRELELTDELTHLLRHPIRRSTGLEVWNGVLTWDHLEDISYSEGLTFLIPLVHRSRFLPEKYEYPSTCSEYLQLSEGGPVVLTVRVEDTAYSRFCLVLDGISSKSSLADLDGKEVSLAELGLLCECQQLIDTTKKFRHPLKLEVSSVLGIEQSRLHRYPTLREEVGQVDWSEFDWTRDIWALQYRFRKRDEGIEWSIVSKINRRVWMDKTNELSLDPTKDTKTLVTQFREAVKSLVSLEHLENAEDVFSGFREDLESRGWTDGTPTFRGAIDGLEDQYTLRIFRTGGQDGDVQVYSADFSYGQLEEIRAALVEEDTDISRYPMSNEEEILQILNAIAEDETMHSGQQEENASLENEYHEVIASYREDFRNDPSVGRFLGSTLLKLGRLYTERDELQEGLPFLQEGVELLEKCNMRNSLVRSDLAEGLILLAITQILLNKIDMRELRQMYDRAVRIIDELPDEDRFDLTRNKLRNLTIPVQRVLSSLEPP